VEYCTVYVQLFVQHKPLLPKELALERQTSTKLCTVQYDTEQTTAERRLHTVLYGTL
jgi:hypothetical protein